MPQMGSPMFPRHWTGLRKVAEYETYDTKAPASRGPLMTRYVTQNPATGELLEEFAELPVGETEAVIANCCGS